MRRHENSTQCMEGSTQSQAPRYYKQCQEGGRGLVSVTATIQLIFIIFFFINFVSTFLFILF